MTADWTPPQESPEPRAHYPLDPEYRRVDSAPLHATHIIEVTLGTSRFDAMLAFFQDVAGLRVLDLMGSPSRHAVLSGGLGRADLVLEEQPEGDAAGLLAATFALSEAASPEALAAAAQALDSPVVRRRDFRGIDVIALRSPDNIEIRLREPAAVVGWL